MANAYGPADDSVLDPKVLEDLRSLQEEGGPDVLTEMIDMYLNNTPARLEALRTAAAIGDGPGMVWAAHSLKGSSGIFGAKRLVRLCEDLQTRLSALEQSDPAAFEQPNLAAQDAGITDRVEALIAEFDRVRVGLQKYRGQGK